MAWDERLVARVRGALAGRRPVGEVRMFGGVCFTLNGNMLCGVDRARLMFRVGKDHYADAVTRPGARPMDVTGKPMADFVFVDPALCDARALKSWIALAVSYVAALPPKRRKKLRAKPPERSSRTTAIRR